MRQAPKLAELWGLCPCCHQCRGNGSSRDCLPGVLRWQDCKDTLCFWRNARVLAIYCTNLYVRGILWGQMTMSRSSFAALMYCLPNTPFCPRQTESRVWTAVSCHSEGAGRILQKSGLQRHCELLLYWMMMIRTSDGHEPCRSRCRSMWTCRHMQVHLCSALKVLAPMLGRKTVHNYCCRRNRGHLCLRVHLP